MTFDNFIDFISELFEEDLISVPHIRVPYSNLDVQELPNGRVTVMPKHPWVSQYRPGEGDTVDSALQDWHDKMSADTLVVGKGEEQ